MGLKGDLKAALAAEMVSQGMVPPGEEVENLVAGLLHGMFARAGTDSCFLKAADDEPLFVLRAQDLIASTTVRVWCNIARLLDANPEKVDQAEAWADVMDKWGGDHGGAADGQKIPD